MDGGFQPFFIVAPMLDKMSNFDSYVSSTRG